MTSAFPRKIATCRTLLYEPDSHQLNLLRYPVPTPNHAAGDHLIKITACSPCREELTWFAHAPKDAGEPFIPGYDISGTVVTSPPGSPFHPGAEIYCRTSPRRAGSLREYGIARTGELCLRPENLDAIEAAGVPMSALTAWQALFGHAGWSVGGAVGARVLVTAAAGGVGCWMVQVAKLAGASVVGTSGPDNVDFLKKLGADEVVDYRNTSIKDWARMSESRKVDLVIDCVGGKSLEDSWWALKEGGTVISIARPTKDTRPKGCGTNAGKSLYFIVETDGTMLTEISEFLKQGKLNAVVDSVLSLSEYQRAFEKLEGGHSRGKVIIEV
jgi:NADPH:quinone reductase-like Zn-dependent oxidoreductase